MVQAQVEVPETWDTIKHEKPIYPTFSRGKVGTALYCNNKYHCYSVHHSKPVHDVMPYRATGFGFAERSMKYIPLTYIQDRNKPASLSEVNEKSEIKKIYEKSIDLIKSKVDRRNCHQLSSQIEVKETNNCELRRNLHNERPNSYRLHQVNKTVRNQQERLHNGL